MLSLSLSGPALTVRQNSRRSLEAPQIAGIKALFDAADLSNLFQDTSMTTVVTASGTSVAAIKDNSGNGYNLTQATAATRPLFKTDDTLYWLEGDGVDDVQTGTVPVSAYPFTIAAALTPISTSGGGIASLHQGYSDYTSLMVNNYMRAQDRTSAATYQAAVDQPPLSGSI